MEGRQETKELGENLKMKRNQLILTSGEIDQSVKKTTEKDGHLIKVVLDALADEKMKRFGIKEYTDRLVELNKKHTYYFEEPKRQFKHPNFIAGGMFERFTRSPLDKKYIASYFGREGERYRYVSMYYYNAGNNSLADYFERLSVFFHQEAQNIFSSESNLVSKEEEKQDGQVKIGRHLAIEKYNRFKNTDMIQVLKEIYRDNCGAAIEKEKYLNEHLTGFLLAIYEMEGCDTDLTKHYHEIFVEKLKNTDIKICALGTYQRYIRTYNRLKNSVGLSILQKNTLDMWEKLKTMYVRGIKERLEASEKLPQLAMSLK